MEMIPVKPERKAQLDAYAKRHGQDSVSALDDLLANYFEWEQQDYKASAEALRRGFGDGQTTCTPSDVKVPELRMENGVPVLHANQSMGLSVISDTIDLVRRERDWHNLGR